MPKQVKRCLERVLPRGFRTFCWRVGSFIGGESIEEEYPSMQWSLKNLRRLGFSPRRVVDVGAYRGDWTRRVPALFPSSQVLMVEPQDAMTRDLERTKCRTTSVRLCDVPSTRPCGRST